MSRRSRVRRAVARLTGVLLQIAQAGSLAVTLAGLTLPVLAQETGSESARPLIEQKLKLLGSLLASPRIAQIEAGDNDAAKALVSEAKALLAQSRRALDAGDLTGAGTAADAAMRTAAAARSGGPTAANPEQQHARNDELLGQVRSYRATIAAAWTAAAEGDAEDALVRLDRQIAEAEELSQAGRYADASRLLADAYKTAVALVSKQSAGQTVVYQLHFATPADEYAYELERHRSHEMLIDVALAERGVAREAIAAFLAKSAEFRATAEAAARRGAYDDAIGGMESATLQLVRALQSLGVSISQ